VTRDELLAARTATWAADARAALATLVDALKPSTRHLGDILDWLDDIAARDGVAASVTLDDAELRRIVASGASAPERLKRWKERLRRLRYPRLAAREQAIVAELRAMDCGPSVTITPPAALEGGMVTVTIRVRSAAELGAALQRLWERLERREVERLFALLDEA